jgi:hypothetical protein
VPGGLHVTPQGHTLYPLGAALVVQLAGGGGAGRPPVRLAGHGGSALTAVAVSPDGRWAATGERADAMARAAVCVWDLAAVAAEAAAVAAAGGPPVVVSAVRPASRLVQHRGAVQALAFSCSGSSSGGGDGGAVADAPPLLASLGGPDDNTLVVWEPAPAGGGGGRQVAAAAAARHPAHVVAWLPDTAAAGSGSAPPPLAMARRQLQQLRLVTAGAYHARLWRLAPAAGTLRPDDLAVGAVKRVFTALALDTGAGGGGGGGRGGDGGGDSGGGTTAAAPVPDDDAHAGTAYLGSTSGDVLAFSLGPGLRLAGASAQRFARGVTALAVVGAAGPSGGTVGGGAATAAAHAAATTTARAGAAPPSLQPTRTRVLLVGTGDGAVGALSLMGGGGGGVSDGGKQRHRELQPPQLPPLALLGPPARVEGAVTSLAPLPPDADGGVRVHVGTAGGNTYDVEVVAVDGGGGSGGASKAPALSAVTTATTTATAVTVTAALAGTAHCGGPVVAAAFPAGTAELLLTAGGGELRLWRLRRGLAGAGAGAGAGGTTPSATGHAATGVEEVLRVAVDGGAGGVTAAGVTPDGRLLVSGWADGGLRAFAPQSGALAWAVPHAQPGGVSALGLAAAAGASGVIFTGGADGRVRAWRMPGDAASVTTAPPALVADLREHTARVTAVAVGADGASAVSASSDGSCVVWRLPRGGGAAGGRAAALFAPTEITGVALAPGEGELVTVGADRRVGLWDAATCSPRGGWDAGGSDGAAAEVGGSRGCALGGAGRREQGVGVHEEREQRADAHAARAAVRVPHSPLLPLPVTPSRLPCPHPPTPTHAPRRAQLLCTAVDASSGRWLVTGDAGGALAVWPYEGTGGGGECAQRVGGAHAGAPVAAVALSDDGARAASAGADGGVAVWRVVWPPAAAPAAAAGPA